MANIIVIPTLVYFVLHFIEEYCFQIDQWFDFQRQHFKFCQFQTETKCYRADLQKLFTGLRMLFARVVATVISSISPPLHFQPFPLVKQAALLSMCQCWSGQ